MSVDRLLDGARTRSLRPLSVFAAVCARLARNAPAEMNRTECTLETAAADGASRVGSVRGSHGRAKRPQLPLGAWTVSHDSIAARERQERANFPSDLARATSVRSCSHVTGSSQRDGAMGACCMMIFDLALLLSYHMLGRIAQPRWSSGSPQTCAEHWSAGAARCVLIMCMPSRCSGSLCGSLRGVSVFMRSSSVL